MCVNVNMWNNSSSKPSVTSYSTNACSSETFHYSSAQIRDAHTHTLSDVQPRRSRNVVASFGHPAATASAGGHVSLHRSVARQRDEVENSPANVPEAEREPSRNK